MMFTMPSSSGLEFSFCSGLYPHDVRARLISTEWVDATSWFEALGSCGRCFGCGFDDPLRLIVAVPLPVPHDLGESPAVPFRSSSVAFRRSQIRPLVGV